MRRRWSRNDRALPDWECPEGLRRRRESGSMNIVRSRALKRAAWLPAGALALSMVAALPATADDVASDVGLPPAADPAVSAFAQQLEDDYIDPDRVYSTDVRWWLGDASHTDETLLEEIQALYDGGFRGVELCMQNDSAASDQVYGYGTEMWAHKWNLMMNKLLDLGMGVYLTSGTNWSTSNVPGLDPTSQSAMQNLTLGTATVQAGESVDVLPTPAANAQLDGASFVTAYAYRIVSDNTVDTGSFVDLAPMLEEGETVWEQSPDWDVPTDGDYRIFALWTQGTYQTSSPANEPSYATNYFDERGVEALKSFWEDHYLADPELRAKILEGDVQLFMDSLEMSTGRGFTWWAEDMAEQFEERKGYDVTPYLFLIDGVGNVWNNPYHSVATAGKYRLDGDEDLRQRVVNDYQDVLTQLYRERMLQPLKTWLNSVGIETRAQISYGQPIEMSEPAMDVDYPETENRNQYNQVDIFRYWTGGAKLENKVLSSETTALTFGANATQQLRLQDAYSQFASGIQRTIWHIWSAGYGYGKYEWPGYETGGFGGGFALMADRFPAAETYDELNAHLGRVQQLMQTGKARSDVGFVQQKFVHGMAYGGGTGSDNRAMNWQLAHQGVQYRSTELQDNGYTYDYFSPRFLFDDDVYFDEGSKTIEKAGYKAIVLYQDWLDFASAQRILDWAKKGLKVVILEDAAARTPFNDGKDGALAKIVNELKGLPTVRQATVYDNIDYFSTQPGGYNDNVIEKLQELGVHPYTGYSELNQQLLTQTRVDDAGNQYLYAYNYDDGSYRSKSLRPEVRNAPNPGGNISTDIEMQGTFVPYIIDAWTGEVTEVADYRWVDGKTIVPFSLDYNDISLMAFEKVDDARLHVTDTSGDSAYPVQGGIAVRTTESGELTTELSDGRSFRDSVTVPERFDVRDWDLAVESWRPGEVTGDLVRTETIDGVTTINRKTSTEVTTIEVELPELTTWDEIPEVGQAVSGVGHYQATFDWEADSATGAYLDFGRSFEESMEVWINGTKVGGEVSTNPTKVKRDVGGVGKPTIDNGLGEQVPLVGEDLSTGGVNWMRPLVDIGPYLQDGDNEIEIRYYSALSNVQLDRGVARVTENASGWWNYDIDYLSFGPEQAVVIPYVDQEYVEDDDSAEAGSDGSGDDSEADSNGGSDGAGTDASGDTAGAEASAGSDGGGDDSVGDDSSAVDGSASTAADSDSESDAGAADDAGVNADGSTGGSDSGASGATNGSDAVPQLPDTGGSSQAGLIVASVLLLLSGATAVVVRRRRHTA
ncbi:LPXTG cell wall anchor domain-containing protein [Pseudactinotalea sp. HY160]|nr:LPXTG cell wall anchor domain-containing protein [Pseudactinotalea sp. HY160]